MEGDALREYVREGKDIGILLRPFGKDWADNLMEIFALAVWNTCAKEYLEEEREAWLSSMDREGLLARLEASHALLAFLGDRPIGFGNIEDGAHLDMLLVHPDCQGMGVASLICDMLESRAERDIRVESSLTAKGFFLRRGYEVLDEEAVYREGGALRRFRMGKNVSPGAPVQCEIGE